MTTPVAATCAAPPVLWLNRWGCWGQGGAPNSMMHHSGFCEAAPLASSLRFPPADLACPGGARRARFAAAQISSWTSGEHDAAAKLHTWGLLSPRTPALLAAVPSGRRSCSAFGASLLLAHEGGGQQLAEVRMTGSFLKAFHIHQADPRGSCPKPCPDHHLASLQLLSLSSLSPNGLTCC